MKSYVCTFEDGPARGQEIHMVVPPTEVRWFLRMETGIRVESWWVFHREPEPDPALSITRYAKVSEETGATPDQIHVKYKEAK